MPGPENDADDALVVPAGPRTTLATVGVVLLMAVVVGGGLLLLGRGDAGRGTDGPVTPSESQTTTATTDGDPSDELTDLPTISSDDFPTGTPSGDPSAPPGPPGGVGTVPPSDLPVHPSEFDSWFSDYVSE